jgi:hypothetical protein
VRAPAQSDGLASREVEPFLPLQDDWVFSYTAWLHEGHDPEQLILQVEHRELSRASLRSGNDVKRLELVADGVRLLGGGYLLKAPLNLGASWAGQSGTVRVTALDKTLRVGAGEFTGCLETTEVGAREPASGAIVTSYCPGVGIVKLAVTSGDREQRFELRSFGHRVDVNEVP